MKHSKNTKDVVPINFAMGYRITKADSLFSAHRNQCKLQQERRAVVSFVQLNIYFCFFFKMSAICFYKRLANYAVSFPSYNFHKMWFIVYSSSLVLTKITFIMLSKDLQVIKFLSLLMKNAQRILFYGFQLQNWYGKVNKLLFQ